MEWLNKTKNAFSKCVLEFNFAPISGPYFFIKKSQNRCTLLYILDEKNIVTAVLYKKKFKQKIIYKRKDIMFTMQNKNTEMLQKRVEGASFTALFVTNCNTNLDYSEKRKSIHLYLIQCIKVFFVSS
jgi:hypothetical protein